MTSLIFYILIAIVAAIAFFIAFKILKSIFKALFTAFIIIIILVGILGVILYIDSGKIVSSLAGPKEFFVEDDGDVISGAILTTENLEITNGLNQDLFRYYDIEELSTAQERYVKKILEKENDALVIVFNKGYLIEEQEIQIEELEATLDENALSQIFDSNTINDAKTILLDNSKLSSNEKKVAETQITKDYSDVQQLKAEIMMILIAERYKEEKLSLILKGHSKGDVVVFPKFVSLTILKIVPEGISKIMIK